MQRWIRAMALGAVTLPLLSACTALDDGVVGVTTDASGRLTAVVAVCRHNIDGLLVDADGKRLLRLEHDRAFTDDFTVTLNDPGQGWTRAPDTGRLEADASYTISG